MNFEAMIRQIVKEADIASNLQFYWTQSKGNKEQFAKLIKPWIDSFILRSNAQSRDELFDAIKKITKNKLEINFQSENYKNWELEEAKL